MKKLFVVKKYVWAISAKDAINKEKDSPIDDVWLDEDWKRSQNTSKGEMGFVQDRKE